jgi:hypothetical protein
MSSSALTSDNSAIVMIDHAVGFGNVFRSHDLSLHVNNTVGLAKTAGIFGIPLVLTNGADTDETLETHQAAVQRMIQAGAVPVTWLSLASQFQGSYTSHKTVPGFLGLISQHSPALGMLFQGQTARQAALAGSSPAVPDTLAGGATEK